MEKRSVRRLKSILIRSKGKYPALFSGIALFISMVSGLGTKHNPILEKVNNLISSHINTNSFVILKLILKYDGFLSIIFFAALMFFIGAIVDSRIVIEKNRYFRSVVFGNPDEETLLRAVDGILNTEKSKPYFVHAVQGGSECNELYSAIKEKRFKNFYTITGKPGEGRSLLAYLISYRLFKNDSFNVFELDVDELISEKLDEIEIDQLLSEFDSLKGARKLIIVDDAERLYEKEKLLNILQEEAKAGSCVCIWIETELFTRDNSKINDKMNIKINFKNNFDNFLKSLKHKESPLISRMNCLNINGLKDAVIRAEENRIKDYWHFIYYASFGEKRLFDNIDKMNKFQLLVLFLISAHTEYNLETPLHIYELKNIYAEITGELKWYAEVPLNCTIDNIIDVLTGPEDKIGGGYLLAIHGNGNERKFDNDDYLNNFISLIHFNFAEKIIKECLQKKDIAEGLVFSLGKLLKFEKPEEIYVSLILKHIGHYTERFVNDNLNWFEHYFNNPRLERLYDLAYSLKSIGNESPIMFNEILVRMDKANICDALSNVDAEYLQAVNNFILFTGIYANEFINFLDLDSLFKTVNNEGIIGIEKLSFLIQILNIRRMKFENKLDIKRFIIDIGEMKNIQIKHICQIIGILEDRRKEFIEMLDIGVLIKKANNLNVESAKLIAYLINNLGSRSEEFINNLDIIRLAGAVSNLEIKDIHNITSLIASLNGRSDEFISKLDLMRLASESNSAKIQDLQNIANFIKRLGDRKDEYINALELEKLADLSNTARSEDIQYISNFAEKLNRHKLRFINRLNIEKLLTELHKSDEINFFQLYYLLKIMNNTRKEFFKEFDYSIIIKASNSIEYNNLHQLQGLIMVMSLLEDSIRYNFIMNIDWVRLIDMAEKNADLSFDIIINLIRNSLNKIQSGNLYEKNGLFRYLEINSEKVKLMISKYKGSNYDLIGEIYLVLTKLDYGKNIDIFDMETILELGRNMKINEQYYRKLSKFLDYLRQADDGTALGFISNNRILERIIEAINAEEIKDPNTDKLSDLRLLIKSINDISTSLWQYAKRYLSKDFDKLL